MILKVFSNLNLRTLKSAVFGWWHLLVCPKPEQNKDRISSVAHVRLLEQLLSEGTRETFAFSVYVFIKYSRGKTRRGAAKCCCQAVLSSWGRIRAVMLRQDGGVLTGSTTALKSHFKLELGLKSFMSWNGHRADTWMNIKAFYPVFSAYSGNEMCLIMNCPNAQASSHTEAKVFYLSVALNF